MASLLHYSPEMFCAASLGFFPRTKPTPRGACPQHCCVALPSFSLCPNSFSSLLWKASQDQIFHICLLPTVTIIRFHKWINVFECIKTFEIKDSYICSPVSQKNQSCMWAHSATHQINSLVIQARADIQSMAKSTYLPPVGQPATAQHNTTDYFNFFYH